MRVQENQSWCSAPRNGQRGSSTESWNLDYCYRSKFEQWSQFTDPRKQPLVLTPTTSANKIWYTYIVPQETQKSLLDQLPATNTKSAFLLARRHFGVFHTHTCPKLLIGSTITLFLFHFKGILQRKMKIHPLSSHPHNNGRWEEILESSKQGWSPMGVPGGPKTFYNGSLLTPTVKCPENLERTKIKILSVEQRIYLLSACLSPLIPPFTTVLSLSPIKSKDRKISKKKTHSVR